MNVLKKEMLYYNMRLIAKIGLNVQDEFCVFILYFYRRLQNQAGRNTCQGIIVDRMSKKVIKFR